MTDNPKIKLLLADVDGTLLTREKVLTERTRHAVMRLRDAGIAFAITSGRPPRGMAMLIEPLALKTPVAGFNGGIFVRPDLSILESRTLTEEAARQTIAIIEKLGLDVWVYAGNDWFIRKPGAPHVDREAHTVQFAPTVVKEFGDLSAANKIVGVSDDEALVKKAEAAVQQALGSQVSASRSQSYYLDVTHPLANKGAVVDYLSRHLAVARDRIATIGDMPNDTLMFRDVGLSIAMGNASAEVQALAKVVTDSCDNDGFAKAVERYLLDDTGTRRID
ncbi:MAG TPA: Cof-type HAD-IIB family hydrolase [Rhizomicrobium sp.]|jgi:hypothetical protein|nr:Cof-type HAD-IIB family hydrolase [Rhizomicrobium sp.]